MKTLIYLLFIPILSVVFFSCGDSHFLKEEDYRNQVLQDFEQKQQALPDGDLFAVFTKTDLTLSEQEALKFLYAYMPIGDITDYPGDYYLENLRLSEQTRREMPWGKVISDELFRHFVLPIRVNNENLDDSRKVFYGELKDRVKNLSMKDAILEVNHWCHEKVVYRPSDARTSSPLASVKTAYGRCGEESTFTVAALRSVGIPARQVYTPRWAHTDDNHAWVEAWADGKWYFFGACEPEPVLNLGWFNAPASRGILMHTKVFGRYNGPEEIMLKTPNYTEINVIENYAPTAKAVVTVIDEGSNIITGAKVDFKVYNYAEYYTVATKYTGNGGQVFMTAGKGDMLVWASKDGRMGFEKLSFGKDEAVTITLYEKEGIPFDVNEDIVPPVEGANLPEVTPEQRAANDIRLAQEDSIRNAYVATMMTEERAEAWVDSLYGNALQPEMLKNKLVGYLVASRGNHQTLTDFLSAIHKKEDTHVSWEEMRALWLLESISAKDLRDVTLDVLNDHLRHSSNGEKLDIDLVRKALLNPRIANEMLTPYKKILNEVISQEIPNAVSSDASHDPTPLIEWIKNKIKINNNLNSQQIPISPMGVWKSRVADEKSRDIFFVAAARSIGIPAWIDEVTGKVQYSNGVLPPQDVNFGTSSQPAQASTGILKAKYTPVRSLPDPKYYSHFTLSKFKDGTFQLLNYDEGDADMGAGTTWSSLLKNGVRLDAGYYMLVTGTRMASGAVLSSLNFFNVEAGKTTTVELIMRESKDEVQVIGNFNSESLYRPLGEDGNVGEPQSLLQTCGRGYYVVGVLGVGQEPTNHALRDIAAFGKEFENWDRKIVLLFPTEEQYKKFHSSEFPGLPSTITYGVDIDNSIQKQIAKSMNLSNETILPMFIVADTFNRVVFVSQGYTIGLGEQLMKVVHGL